MSNTQTSKNILIAEGHESFAVHQHIILKNHWEYYLGKTDKNGIAFGYVMGFENEWGDVSMEEIKPHIMTQTTDLDLDEVMPPAGYSWEEDEQEHALNACGDNPHGE
jgi:hypothetical protein